MTTPSNNQILDKIFSLTNESMLFQFIFEQIKNKTKNISINVQQSKLILLIMSGILMLSMVGFLSYYLYFGLFIFAGLKCLLWLIEHYDPQVTGGTDEGSDTIMTQYVSEPTPSDVIEYMIVPIVMFALSYPILFIPIPFIPSIIHLLGMAIGFITFISKQSRQRFCIAIRDSVKKSEIMKETHRLLQLLCYTIECVNISTYHIVYNPRSVIHNINRAEDLKQSLYALTSYVNPIPFDNDESQINNNLEN